MYSDHQERPGMAWVDSFGRVLRFECRAESLAYGSETLAPKCALTSPSNQHLRVMDGCSLKNQVAWGLVALMMTKDCSWVP